MTTDTPAALPGYFTKASHAFMELDISSDYQGVSNMSGPPTRAPPVPPLHHHDPENPWAEGNSLTTTIFDGNLGNPIDIFTPEGYAHSNLDMAQRSIEGGTPHGITANAVPKSRTTTLLPDLSSRQGVATQMEEQGAYVQSTNGPFNPNNALADDRYLLNSCISADCGDDSVFPSNLEPKFAVPYSGMGDTTRNCWTLQCPTGVSGHTGHAENNRLGYISSGSGCEDLGETDSVRDMFPSAVVRELGNVIKPATDMDVQQDMVCVKSEDTTSVGPSLSIDYDEIQEIWRQLSSLGNPSKQANDQIPNPDPSTLNSHAVSVDAPAAGTSYKRTRAEQLSRYREKKMRRATHPKIRYKLLKANADRRPRIKGRFVKKSEMANSS